MTGLRTVHLNLDGGYRVIPARYEGYSARSHTFWKSHEVRKYNLSKPPGRTLLVVNIPPYVNETCVKMSFIRFGNIVSIFMHKKPESGVPDEVKYPFFAPNSPIKGFKVAYIIFEDETGLERAMNFDPTTDFIWRKTEEDPVGIKKFIKDYNDSFKSEEELRKEARRIIEEYDAKKEAEKKTTDGVPDDEGWITVQSGAKRKRPTEKAGDRNTKSAKRQKRKSHLVNFYAFQQREQKMEHLAQLRKKFEEDKKRVAMLRASRKFKPL